MKKEKIVRIVYCVACAVMLIVIILLARSLFAGIKDKPQQQSEATDKDKGGKLFDDFAVVEEIVTVNTQIIEDGLKEMGTLITEEYYFTQVEAYKSSERKWIFDSNASMTFSYDGVVTAGIDCNKVTIEKDDENKTVTVKLPKADIIDVVVDFESFKIYEEKNGLWNKLDMSKFNNSLIEFENAARAKALEKGILKSADESAQKMISSFVNSLVDNEEYSVEIVVQ